MKKIILTTIAIAFLLIRVQTLVDVLRGSGQKRVGLSNKINAAALLVSMILGFALMEVRDALKK